MAKLTNKQRLRLDGVLKSLERGNAFILHPDTVVARKCRPDGAIAYVVGNPSAAEHYPHSAVTPIDKEIGSGLCLLTESVRLLRAFLEDEIK